MIPPAASAGSRRVVRAATSALFAAAIAFRESTSPAACDVFLACARLYVLAEHSDLLLVERYGRRAVDVDFTLHVPMLVQNLRGRLSQLEENLLAAASGLDELADGSGRSLQRAARLYTEAWMAKSGDRSVSEAFWRVNRAGLFNVPADPGRLARPWPLPSRAQLDELGARVRSVRFVDDWRDALQLARASDLVLSDPPYLGGFVAYTAARFPVAEQQVLAQRLADAAAAGAAVIAFNSLIARPLYAGWAQIATCRRSERVPCRGSGRQPVRELIATAALRPSHTSSKASPPSRTRRTPCRPSAPKT